MEQRYHVCVTYMRGDPGDFICGFSTALLTTDFRPNTKSGVQKIMEHLAEGDEKIAIISLIPLEEDKPVDGHFDDEL